jgi:hypothetical protein
MFDNWKDALILDRLGKIWWYNLQFDLSHENLPTEINELFVRAVQKELEILGSPTPPLDPLICVLGELPVITPAYSPPNFSLQGLRAPKVEPFSRVVDAHAFSHFNIDWGMLGLETGETLKDTVWKMFRDGEIDPARHFTGYMNSRRGFFWGVPTRRLKSVFDELGVIPVDGILSPPEEGDRVATEFRNLLGLSYMYEGIGLYLIDIPVECLNNIKVCAPTTLDSSPTCVFLPADEETGYGWTLHLDRLEKGAEEVVIHPIEFTGKYHVTQIGFISGPLPDNNAVWSTLEKMVEERLNAQS